MTRPMLEEREKLEPCPKLREAIENGHLRCSVSVGVGSPVATIDTEDLWRLVHAAERSLSTSAAVRGMREALEASLKALDILMPGVGRVTSSMEEVSAINSAYYLGTRALAALSGIEPGEDEQATRAIAKATTP